MIQIVKISFHDDKDGSTSVDVMVCSSMGAAREVVLDNINKQFDGTWKTLTDAAKELNTELEHCSCSYDEKEFIWLDNGKGENYLLGRIDEREVNTKFQNIG